MHYYIGKRDHLLYERVVSVCDSSRMAEIIRVIPKARKSEFFQQLQNLEELLFMEKVYKEDCNEEGL